MTMTTDTIPPSSPRRTKSFGLTKMAKPVNFSYALGLRAEHAAPDVLYLLGWKQAVQPRQDSSVARPDQVSKPQAFRRDNPLPNGIGKDIGLHEREVVSDCGGASEEMPTVLLPQRFGDQRPLLGVDLRSQLDHRGLDATRYEVGDLDAERRQLHAEVLGEDHQGRLRC
jgi:hypothetical protein